MTPKTELGVKQTVAGLLNKGPCVAPALVGKNSQISKILIWSHFVVLSMTYFMFNKQRLFVEEKLMLGSSFSCDLIHKR